MSESDYPSKTSSARGTIWGYGVEVRCLSDHHDADIGGNRITSKWTKLQFAPATVGVPIGFSSESPLLQQTRLLSYTAAQALRWWAHAHYEANYAIALMLETKIVAHEIKYSIEVTKVSEHKPIGGEDRSCLMPDWNTDQSPSSMRKAQRNGQFNQQSSVSTMEDRAHHSQNDTDPNPEGPGQTTDNPMVE